MRETKFHRTAHSHRRGPAFAHVEKSYEIGWAGLLALQLASARKREVIGLEEYFAGIYLINRDALVRYWADGAKLDAFVRRACELSEPVWYYWIEFDHAMRSLSKSFKGIGLVYSKEAASVLESAARLALKPRSISRKKHQLCVEHVMAALAAHRKLKFTRRLLASGADLQKLRATASTR
jgi:hypothetical protein